MFRKKRTEPAIYYDGMAQRNGSPVFDIPDAEEKPAVKDDTAARYNLVEEMADVLICMKQMQEIYGITDHDIQLMADKKCRRQEARL